MSTWRWLGDIQTGTSGQRVATGSGSPEGVITAPVGSLYLRSDGSTNQAVYIKETGAGNTGWVAIGAGGSSITLNHNGSANSSQAVLDIVAGSNITVTDLGSGRLQLAGASPTTSAPFMHGPGIFTVSDFSQLTVTNVTTAPLEVGVYKFFSPYAVDLTKVGFQASSSLLAGQNLIFGIYDSVGSLVWSSQTFHVANGTDLLITGTLSTHLIFSPGVYYLAVAADGSDAIISSFTGPITTHGVACVQSNSVYWGRAANAATSGPTLPGTLGVITGYTALDIQGVPAMLFE